MPSLNTAVVPSIRPDYSAAQLSAWLQRHDELVVQARCGGIEVAFFGDSLVEQWGTVGKDSWERTLAPLRAGNFGISGDRTQQVLWRMLHGELDGLNAKTFVLLVGTNNTDPGLGDDNLTPRNSTPEIVAGVAAIIDLLRVRFPFIPVLLHGLFPRGVDNSPIRSQIAEINVGLASLASANGFVSFIDVGPRLLSSEGRLSTEIMPDLLHLSPAGYDIWADDLRGALAVTR